MLSLRSAARGPVAKPEGSRDRAVAREGEHDGYECHDAAASHRHSQLGRPFVNFVAFDLRTRKVL